MLINISMYLHKHIQLKQLSIQRAASQSFYTKKKSEQPRKLSADRQAQKRRSSSILDAKTIKQKLAIFLNDERLRKSQSEVHNKTFNISRKKVRDSIKINTQKKKLRDLCNRKIFNKEKMEIVGSDTSQFDESEDKIPEITIPKKIIPIIPTVNSHKAPSEFDNCFRVLAMNKNIVHYDHFTRKPSLPPRYSDSPVQQNNNFLKTRKYFKPKINQEIARLNQPLQPWSQAQQQCYFPDLR